MIADHPGIDELSATLTAIDLRARAADAAGDRFEFMSAYNNELLC